MDEARSESNRNLGRIGLVRKLIEECEEFKRIINYDEILRQREEKANEEQKHYAEVS
jgi:hypothetical protein